MPEDPSASSFLVASIAARYRKRSKDGTFVVATGCPQLRFFHLKLELMCVNFCKGYAELGSMMQDVPFSKLELRLRGVFSQGARVSIRNQASGCGFLLPWILQLWPMKNIRWIKRGRRREYAETPLADRERGGRGHRSLRCLSVQGQ